MHRPSTHPGPHPGRPIRLRLALVLAMSLAMSLAACGDSGGADAPDPAAQDAAVEDPAGEDPAAAGAADDAAAPTTGDVVVDVAATDLGDVLVDAEGLTLYGFTNDTGGTSSCTDDCAATWPPVVVEEGFAVGDGLDAAVFTTTERDDGSLQLVAGDWPLYRYAADSSPGDTTGQGVGDVWFVVDASGQLVQDAADSSAASGPGTDY